MRRLLWRLGLCAFGLWHLTGCVTYLHPATGPESLASKAAESPGASGYLAMTASFDLKSFTTYPSVELVVEDEAGKELTLKVGADDLLAFPKSQETVPLVFVLPVGRYRVTRTLMNIPGGYVNGRHFDASEHLLSVEKELQPFAIAENHLVHLAVVRFAMTESQSNRYLYYYAQTSVNPTKPDEKIWAPYKPLLAKTSAVYLKKTQINTYSWPPLSFGGSAKDTEEPPLVAGKKMLDPNVIQNVTQSKRGEVGACHLHYSPKATGSVDITYVVAPQGHVKEAKLTKSTLGVPETEGCILGIVRKLKFPKTPDDDFETWTLTWDFHAAK